MTDSTPCARPSGGSRRRQRLSKPHRSSTPRGRKNWGGLNNDSPGASGSLAAVRGDTGGCALLHQHFSSASLFSAQQRFSEFSRIPRNAPSDHRSAPLGKLSAVSFQRVRRIQTLRTGAWHGDAPGDGGHTLHSQSVGRHCASWLLARWGARGPRGPRAGASLPAWGHPGGILHLPTRGFYLAAGPRGRARPSQGKDTMGDNPQEELRCRESP